MRVRARVNRASAPRQGRNLMRTLQPPPVADAGLQRRGDAGGCGGRRAAGGRARSDLTCTGGLSQT